MLLKKYLPVFLILLLVGVVVVGVADPSHASWTPLSESDDFDGIKQDVLTAAAGIVSVVLVIIGLSWLVRAFVK